MLEPDQAHGGKAVLMKGVKGFLESSFLDWQGRICAVVFLGGCNFRCPYCHNPQLVMSPEEQKDIPWEEVAASLLALRGWVDGVCITGGEPTLYPWLNTLLDQIKALGFEVKLDTNGSRPEVLARLIKQDLIRAVSMDVKAPLRLVPYRRAIGVDPPLEEISGSIQLLGASSLEVEFRTTLVPGFFREEDVLEIASWLPPKARYTLNGFRPGRSLEPSLDRGEAFPEEELKRLRESVRKLRGNPGRALTCPLPEQAYGLQVEGLGKHVKGLNLIHPVTP